MFNVAKLNKSMVFSFIVLFCGIWGEIVHYTEHLPDYSVNIHIDHSAIPASIIHTFVRQHHVLWTVKPLVYERKILSLQAQILPQSETHLHSLFGFWIFYS